MTREERFWQKVNKSGPKQTHMKTRCWVWTTATRGGHEKGGSYGHFWDGEKFVQAHNYALRLAGRQAHKGKQPDHLCRIKTCVRTSHIQFVTTRENCRRRNEKKTHCVNGHEFTKENTLIVESWNTPPGKKKYWQITRRCKKCRHDYMTAYRERQKEKFGGAEELSRILSKVQRTEGKRRSTQREEQRARKIKIVRNKMTKTA